MTAEADRAWRATRRPGNRRRLRSTPRSASFLISAGGCSPLARCCSRTALRGLLRPPEAGQGHGDRRGHVKGRGATSHAHELPRTNPGRASGLLPWFPGCDSGTKCFELLRMRQNKSVMQRTFGFDEEGPSNLVTETAWKPPAFVVSRFSLCDGTETPHEWSSRTRFRVCISNRPSSMAGVYRPAHALQRRPRVCGGIVPVDGAVQHQTAPVAGGS